MKVYGPYTRKDGRRHVIHYDSTTGNKRTQSYPRYLMEEHLGRALESWEHVDHINDDPTDDRIENYQILTQTENSKKASKGILMAIFICPVCKKEAKKSYGQVKHNWKMNKDGPFCSKSCAGKYSTSPRAGTGLRTSLKTKREKSHEGSNPSGDTI
jgi:hypothetical protein